MNLRAAFLAREAVNQPDGTFDIVGGGITDFHLQGGHVLGRPIRLTFAVVVRLELTAEEAGQLRPLQMVVMFEGRQIAPGTTVPLVARPVPNEPRLYHNVIMNMTIDVPGPGDGYLLFTWEAGLVSVPRLHFRVGQRPA